MAGRLRRVSAVACLAQGSEGSMDRPDDEDDFLPPSKKSGPSVMLILGIVLGAGVLLVLLVLIMCGARFFYAEKPPQQLPRAVDERPDGKVAPAKNEPPNGMKANGPPGGPGK